MTDPAATLALCSWLKKRITEWEAQAKAALELVPGERKAAQLNGVTVGYTNKVRGRKRFRVINEAGFTEWVSQRWPDEIVTYRQVNPAFREKLEKQACALDGLIDDDGEVCPHVEVVAGEPYLTTKLSDEADITIAGLLAKGALGVNGLKEIAQ